MNHEAVTSAAASHSADLLSNYGQWVTPLAIIISAAVATFMAILAIRSQRAIARRRTTFDKIDRTLWDAEFQKERKNFSELREKEDMFRWAVRDVQAEGDGRQNLSTILIILNDYENMAIGIEAGIVDEELYFRWTRSTAVADWDAVSTCVGELRKQRKHDSLFVKFQALAEQWSHMAPDVEWRTRFWDDPFDWIARRFRKNQSSA